MFSSPALAQRARTPSHDEGTHMFQYFPDASFYRKSKEELNMLVHVICGYSSDIPTQLIAECRGVITVCHLVTGGADEPLKNSPSQVRPKITFARKITCWENYW